MLFSRRTCITVGKITSLHQPEIVNFRQALHVQNIVHYMHVLKEIILDKLHHYLIIYSQKMSSHFE